MTILLKQLKIWKKNDGVDEILGTVIEKETLISENKYDNDSIGDLKKDFANEIEKLKEAVEIYTSENGPEILKTDFPDKSNILSKK